MMMLLIVAFATVIIMRVFDDDRGDNLTAVDRIFYDTTDACMNFASEIRPFTSTSNGTSKQRVPLSKPCLINGRILDRETEKSISNAAVIVTCLENSESWTTETSNDGHFELRLDLSASLHQLELLVDVECNGYNTYKTKYIQESDIAIDLGTYYLEKHRTLKLQVVDPDDCAVYNAQVVFYSHTPSLTPFKYFTDSAGFVSLNHWQIEYYQKNCQEAGIYVASQEYADAHYYISLARSEDFPQKIQLKAKRTRSGRVVEKKSGIGLSGIKVGVHTNFWYGASSIIKRALSDDRLCVNSDDSGHFTIPVVDFYGSEDHSIFFSSPRYIKCDKGKKFDFSNLSQNQTIYMRDIKGFKYYECLALDESTQKPLSNCVISRICDNEKSEKESLFITDRNGVFLYPMIETESFMSGTIDLVQYLRDNLRLIVQGRHLYCDGSIRNQQDDLGRYVVKFLKTNVEKIVVDVIDELGNPISGAFVMGKFKISDLLSNKKRGYVSEYRECTNDDGRALLRVVEHLPLEFYVSISHYQYPAFVSEPFNLQIDEHRSKGKKISQPILNKKYILKRGIAYRNLKVVDETGEPLADKYVEIKYQTKSCESIDGFIKTDRRGLGEFVFVPFSKGTMCVYNRQDTKIEFDFDDIKRNDRLTIVCSKNPQKEFAIQGRVVDMLGNSISGVRVSSYVMEGEKHLTRVVSTDDQGYFSLPVYKERTYWVKTLTHTREGGWWYKGLKKERLIAGDEILFTLEPFNGVNVEFDEIIKNRGKLFRYDSWLEDESGRKISFKKINKTGNRVEYYDVPEGMMRAVLVTQDGLTHMSNFFEVVDGKSPRIKIKDRNS